jgi:hypothetical protein
VWDEFPEDYPSVEFRLVYEGELKAAGSGKGSGRASEKHAIRRVLHSQLASLWQMIPHLKDRTEPHSFFNAPAVRKIASATSRTVHFPGYVPKPSLLETLGNQFDRCGYKFVPLVSEHLKLSCGLDILFLRRDMPGIPLIHAGGDLDNRLKVLLDALQMPDACAGFTKQPDEDSYFFVLMQNDKMLTEISVTTDTLLTPCNPGHENDVHLIIKVKIRPTDFSFETLAFVP